jgi:hypothetical protein
MNEIKRLKAWYKKKIEDWENTVCALGFISMILNLLLMTFFLVTKGKMGLLFLLSVVIQGFGINFLTHEHEIESREEFLKIFLKKIIKCSKTKDRIEIASHNYQKIPYDMLIKALGDYGFSVANISWKPFTEKDYDKGSMLYLIRGHRNA